MNDMPRIAIARVEWIGDEQVIRLPKGYHLATTEVHVTFGDDGVVVDELQVEVDTWSDEELQHLAQEGLDSGPDEPWDVDEIKRDLRAAIAAKGGSRGAVSFAAFRRDGIWMRPARR